MTGYSGRSIALLDALEQEERYRSAGAVSRH
jgi:hypothetical protein